MCSAESSRIVWHDRPLAAQCSFVLTIQLDWKFQLNYIIWLSLLLTTGFSVKVAICNKIKTIVCCSVNMGFSIHPKVVDKGTHTHSRTLTRAMFSQAEPKSCQRNCFPQSHSHNYPQLTMRTEQKQGPNQTRAQMRQKTRPQLSCRSVQHYEIVIYGRYLHKYETKVTNVN